VSAWPSSSQSPAEAPREARSDRLSAPTRNATVAERRGLSNGFARPSAPPPLPPRIVVALRAVGFGRRPVILGAAVGVVLFFAFRVATAGA